MKNTMMNVSEIQLWLARFTEIEWYLGALFERFLPINRSAQTSKERVRRAIEFRNPDRIPHRFFDTIAIINSTPISWQPPDGFYPYVHPYDVKYNGWKWNKRNDSAWLNETRTAIDEFGVIWRASAIASMGEPIKGPLEDGWHLLHDYKLPNMKDPARLAPAKKFLKLVNPQRYIIGSELTCLGPWELFRHLRGFNNAMMDIIDHPERVYMLMEMITKMILDSVNNFQSLGVDAYMLADDWGTQQSSFISPKHFRDFFMPCYQKISEKCHEYGMHCGLHSCGNIRPLIPHMIEAGFDFLQLDSPNMCGLDWLAENVVGKTCLFCSVDIQTVYPSNNPDKIEDYVKGMIEKLALDNGGLASWPYNQPYDIGVGARTIKTEQRLFKKYGAYPLDRSLLQQ